MRLNNIKKLKENIIEKLIDFKDDIESFYKRRIKYPIYDLYYGIENLFKWGKVIYEDRDWDYIFLLILIHKKLDNMQKFFTDDSWVRKDDKAILQRIKTTKLLLQRIIDDNYLENALIDYEKKYKIDYNFSQDVNVPILNNDNTKFFTLKARKDTRTEKQRKEYRRYSKHSVKMQQQDLDLVFKYLRKYICKWWS